MREAVLARDPDGVAVADRVARRLPQPEDGERPQGEGDGRLDVRHLQPDVVQQHGQPLPTYGIVVAWTVRFATFASGGKLAM